jgi:dCTP deaminase
MAFWTTEKLFEVLATKEFISDFNPKRIKVGAYELSMGSEYFVTADENGIRQTKKKRLSPDEQFVIPPGQFALLITEEVINLPGNVIGFISIKASVKFRGLINISGFHVDPGFSGRLKFSVQNAGSRPAVFAQGQALFPIWFSELDRTTKYPYNGEHNNQQEITPKDVEQISGEIASPGQLLHDIVGLRTQADQRYEELRHQISRLESRLTFVLGIVAIPFILGIVLVILQLYLQKSPPPFVVNFPPPQAVAAPLAATPNQVLNPPGTGTELQTSSLNSPKNTSDTDGSSSTRKRLHKSQ